LENREEAVAAVDEKIEQNFELIGSTAIEDRLQDEVADTIQFMRDAGIKVWVLTGDKIETAMNIGLSAGLLDHAMTVHVIEEVDAAELHQKLAKVFEDVTATIALHNHKVKQAVVVAGASLVKIDEQPELREKFLDGAVPVDVVLACRVSPKQKADVVNMVRRRYPQKSTLSVGDGANDVSMILQAHVGVGIFGKEGQ
jgi:phospholipid-transporting ATPase